MNLVNVATGWRLFLQASPATQARMTERLAICETCPHKQVLDPVTKALVKATANPVKSLYRCGLCKCPLAALTSVPGKGCRAKKW